MCDELLLSCCFQDSLIVFGFQQFDCVSHCGSLSFSCLEFVELLDVYICLSSKLFNFHHYSGNVSPLSLSSSGIPTVCMSVSLVVVEDP